jgi:hypothetical protein
MLKTLSNAYGVCSAALSKVKEISQPVRKFILHIVPLWLSMNCRMTFMNLQRWGGRSEKSYRSMFSKSFDWFSFNLEVVKSCLKGKVIAVFDPFYLPKSGKNTYGVARFYSGTAQRALKGLEASCLCFVGVRDHTALHALAEQSPTPEGLHAEGKTLVDHYLSIILKHLEKILSLTEYLVVDGYFMKKEFILPLIEQGLQVITKARSDANLRYLYKGKQKSRGRKKRYDGKIEVSRVDKRRIPLVYRDGEQDIYAGVVYSVALKREVLVAFVYDKDKKTGKYKTNSKGKVKPEIILSTDTGMKPLEMCRYYGLRYQVEFLIREAKSYCGVEHCQARSKEKLHTHFNVSLTAVSIAKAAYYLSVPKKKREGFSMMDIKMQHMNALIANRIFSNLEIDPSCEKYQQVYEECLNFGRLRA